MSALQIYRDDGPLAGWIGRRLGPAGRPPPALRPLEWLVPPLVRVLEYGSLVALAVVAEPEALTACFVFLAVLAFHHYDTVYRLRHQRVPPSPWVRAVGGGWEGRLLVASALAVGGGLRIGFFAAAAGLALVFAAESALSWARFARGEGPALHEDEDEDGD